MSNIRQEILEAIQEIGGTLQKRYVPTLVTLQPAANKVTVGDRLISGQLMSLTAYDASNMPLSGSDFLSKIASITGITDDEWHFFVYAITTAVPTSFASQLQFFIIGDASNNIEINLNAGHGISKIRIAFLPPLYLVNP